MVGRSRQWVEQRIEACTKTVAELTPDVVENQKKALVLMILGGVAFVISLPLPQPRDFVMIGVGWVFFMLHWVWLAKGETKKRELRSAQWELESLKLALQLAHTIAFEEQLLQAGEPVNGGIE